MLPKSEQDAEFFKLLINVEGANFKIRNGHTHFCGKKSRLQLLMQKIVKKSKKIISPFIHMERDEFNGSFEVM